MRRAHLVTGGILLALTAGTSAIDGSASPARRTRNAPGIVVVLKDSSPPSQRVRFDLSGAAAVREEGAAVPLQPVRPAGPSRGAPDDGVREFLWLEGEAPAGSYTGIEVSFRSAARPGPGEDEILELPASPTKVVAPFVVSPGAGTVLAVTLRSSLKQEAPGRFEPVLEAAPRPRPTTGLIGVASVGGWDSVALFDKRTGALASLLAVGSDPEGLALDLERVRAYVAVAGEDTVAVLDLLEGRVRERVSLRAGDAPRDVALTPDGRTLVVANPGSDTVSFVDPLSAIEVERLPVAGRPSWLLMDRDGRRVFVLAERSSAISVLSVASRSLAGTIAVDSGPVRARLSGRRGESILVAHSESPYMSVVDSLTLTVGRRVYVGPGARALEVDPRSGRIYLARARTGRIEVFEPLSFLPVAEIPVPGEVAWLSVESEGNGLGVLLRDVAEARIVGLVGGGTTARTPLGPDPYALRFVQGRTAP